MSKNVTITAASFDSLVFSPLECNNRNEGGWKTYPGKGASGSYRSCTTEGNVIPSAKFIFTGVAVYYQSIYIERASMVFKLDGISSGDISLSLPPGTQVAPNSSKVMWHKGGLSNTEHTLEILPADNGKTLNIDAIVYTQVDAASAIRTSSSPSPSPSPSSLVAKIGPAVAAQATTAALTRNSQSIGLIVGTLIGAISGIIFLVVIFFMWRRQRELRSERRAVMQDMHPSTFNERQFDSRFTASKSGQAPIHAIENDRNSHDLEKAETQTQQTEMTHSTQFSPPSSPRIDNGNPVRPLPTLPRDSARSPHSHMEDIREEGGSKPLEWTAYHPSSKKTHRSHPSDDTNLTARSEWDQHSPYSQTSLIRQPSATMSGDGGHATTGTSSRHQQQNPFVPSTSASPPSRTNTALKGSSKLEPLRKGSTRTLGF